MKVKVSSPGAYAPPAPDKYKKKLKDLKRKNREIEEENDRLVLKITRARKDIERLRAERSFLFQKLDEFDRLSRGNFAGTDFDTALTGGRGGRREDLLEGDTDDFVDVEGTPGKPGGGFKKGGITLTLPSGGGSGVPAAAAASSSAAAKKPERDPNAPKKPLNAFKFYCQAERARDRDKFSKMALSEQTRTLGAAWKVLSAEEKKVLLFSFLVFWKISKCLPSSLSRWAALHGAG